MNEEEHFSSLMLTAKLKFEADLAKEFSSNQSRVYRYIKSLQKDTSLPSVMYIRNEQASSKASIYNKYFHLVFTESDYDLPPLDSIGTPIDVLSDISIRRGGLRSPGRPGSQQSHGAG